MALDLWRSKCQKNTLFLLPEIMTQLLRLIHRCRNYFLSSELHLPTVLSNPTHFHPQLVKQGSLVSTPRRHFLTHLVPIQHHFSTCRAPRSSQVASSSIIFERRQTSLWLISPKLCNSHQRIQMDKCATSKNKNTYFCFWGELSLQCLAFLHLSIVP